MKYLKHLITALFVTMLATPAALAQVGSLPNPGITPDNPFYFLDKWGETFGRLFAVGQQAKAAKQAEHAEERLAEAQAMANEGKDELAEEAAREYGALISEAAANLAAAAQGGEDTSAALADLVTKATGIHLTVLADVYQKVPEQAKPAIERAMTQSAQGQEAALNALGGTQREAAEEQVEQAEEQLNILRQQGIPIPEIQSGVNGSTDSGRPTTGPAAGELPISAGQ